MDREPIGTGRLPALGGCQATISSSIGVDLPIPEKPTLATARWWPAWRVASPLRKRNTRDATVVIRPEPQQQRGVVPAPSTADPVPRGCSAGAAAQHALAVDCGLVDLVSRIEATASQVAMSQTEVVLTWTLCRTQVSSRR
jgi:hypothetical protein